MKVNFEMDKNELEIKKGCLLITDRGSRLVIYDDDEELYYLLIPETCEIATEGYYGIQMLIDDYIIKKIIQPDELYLEVK